MPLSKDFYMREIFEDIADERTRQDEKWGPQNHSDGTGDKNYKQLAESIKQQEQYAAKYSQTTWDLILLEEVFEALAEEDVTKLRTELIESAAVIVAWVEAIDRRDA